VRRAEGTLHTYREAAHKQLVATMANLTFLAKNRKEILADYLAEKRKSVGQGDAAAAVPERTFAVVPGANATRLRRLMNLLSEQSFEVSAAAQPFTASGKDRLGRLSKDHAFPAGTLLIPARQPLARLVAAMLEFDPRMSPEAVTDERRELLRFDRSRIYDITAWSIPMLFDVECYEIGAAEGAQPQAAKAPTVPADPLQNLQTTVGFVIDGADDGAVAAAGRLMERGVRVRCADKPFTFDGRGFARGSVVVLLKDNPPASPRIEHTVDPLLGALRQTCNDLSLTAAGITSGLGPGDLPDLGGQHFVLLQQPRIAIVGRDPISPYGFGQAWYFIDHVLGLRASYIDAANLGGSDLRRYNVLVIPPGGGDALKDKMDDLRAWAKSGGTLIAMGSSAAALAKEKDGIGSTRVVPDVLGKLDPYRQAVVREWEGLRTTPEAKDVWAFSPPEEVVYPWMIGEQAKADEDELKRRDAWRAIFMPAGAILAGRVDDRSWLTAGCGEYLPVLFSSDPVLLTPPGVQAPVRLGYFNPAPEKAEEKPKGDAPAAKGDQLANSPPKGPPVDAAAAKPADSKDQAKSEKPDASGDAKKSDPKKDDSKDDSKKDEKPAPGWTLAPKGYELRLRMSGLLWPEAAERVANAAYVTREGIGAGQVILFAGDPTFRGGALGTARLFENAVVFGPGMGASQPIQP
jgi:hypothetical protein